MLHEQECRICQRASLKAGVVCEVEKALGIEKLMVGLQTEQAVCVCKLSCCLICRCANPTLTKDGRNDVGCRIK